MTATAFSGGEVAFATVATLAIETAFFVLLYVAGAAGHVTPKEEVLPETIPIAVKPVMDDLPLLKLGGKKVKAKLPDMWQKPKLVKRYKAQNLPSEKAEKTPDAIPSAEPPEKMEEIPEDAELAKEVDEDIPETDEDVELANLPEEGAADGVVGGTESDPLKARAISQYKMKLQLWFSGRLTIPNGMFTCEQLKTLSAGVVAQIGGDRNVAGFSIVRPSGNAQFDGLVTSTMQRTQGQVLPPPPPKYPDILESSLSINFTRKFQPCE